MTLNVNKLMLFTRLNEKGGGLLVIPLAQCMSTELIETEVDRVRHDRERVSQCEHVIKYSILSNDMKHGITSMRSCFQ